MKGCFGTKEFSVKSRICKNCSVFCDCEAHSKRNANKFMMVSAEELSAKREAFAKA